MSVYHQHHAFIPAVLIEVLTEIVKLIIVHLQITIGINFLQSKYGYLAPLLKNPFRYFQFLGKIQILWSDSIPAAQALGLSHLANASCLEGVPLSASFASSILVNPLKLNLGVFSERLSLIFPTTPTH